MCRYHAELMEDFLAAKAPGARPAIKPAIRRRQRCSRRDPTTDQAPGCAGYGKLMRKNREKGNRCSPASAVQPQRKTWGPFLQQVQQSALP